MTTIAFKDGVIAGDRLTSEGAERYGFAKKIGLTIDADGTPCAFGAIGSAALSQRFAEWARVGLPKGAPPPEMASGEAKASGLLFYADGRLVSFDPGVPSFEVTMHHIGGSFVAGMGSGGQFALGAMAAGAGAETAVALALLFDAGSGGSIDVEHLPSG